MAQAERHLVIGASGALGSAVTRLLLSERKRVTAAFIRDPDKLRRLFLDKEPFILPGDARDPNALRQAALGASTLYYAIRIGIGRRHWEHDTLACARLAIEAARVSGARLVVPMSVDRRLPAEGDGPARVEAAALTRRGQLALEFEGLLAEAHAQGDLHYTLLRIADLYGPHITHGAFAPLWRALAARHVPAWPGALGDLHEWVFTADAARALAVLGEAPNELVNGRRFQLPGPEACTVEAWLRLWLEKLERTTRPRRLSALERSLWRLFSPEAAELLDLAAVRPALDGRTFKENFGFLPATSYIDGIAQTLAYSQLARR